MRIELRRTAFSGSLVGALVGIAVCVGGSASPVRAAAAPGSAPIVTATTPAVARPVLRRLAGLPESGERVGAPTAPVRATLYGDLECGLCRSFVLGPAFATLLTDEVRPGRVELRYRSLCTATCVGASRHVFTVQQAAAYAAGAQNRFWPFAAVFIARQPGEMTGYVTERFLDQVARAVPGLVRPRWQRDRRAERFASQVRAEDRNANRTGISGTPTLVLSGPRGTRRVEDPRATARDVLAAVAAVR